MIYEHHITILFDPPYWLALFERFEDQQYSVARVIMDTAEPENTQLKTFFDQLDLLNLSYSRPERIEKAKKEHVSFKKQQKLVKKATTDSKHKHVYTKAQILLKEQFEESKMAHKKQTRLEIEEEENRKFELKQQKRKEKHRGH